MDKIEIGRTILKELRGPEYQEKREQTRNSFNSAIQDYTDEVCFGTIWARPGIDRKLRSLLNVAMLAAMNRPGPLRGHIDGAVTGGATAEEIQEVLLQVAVYAGLPAAVDAFRIAEEVLAEHKML